jgi:hypothetical protein
MSNTTATTTLKQLEIIQVHSTKAYYEFQEQQKEMQLVFYRPFGAGIPTIPQIVLYTKQQLEDDYELDQTYKFYSVVDIKEVYRYDERFDFPQQLSLQDIVDNSYYQFKVSLKIKKDDEY